MLCKVYKFKPGKVFILMILLFHTIPTIAQPDPIQTMYMNELLKKHTWQKRILLIVYPSANDKKYVQQKAILEYKNEGIQQRDMVVMAKVADELSQAEKIFLDKKFGIEYTRFNAILIGKDGNKKLDSVEPIPSEKLFETIDAMPMRQQEINRNSNKE